MEFTDLFGHKLVFSPKCWENSFKLNKSLITDLQVNQYFSYNFLFDFFVASLSGTIIKRLWRGDWEIKSVLTAIFQR